MAGPNDDVNIKINSDATGAVKGSKDTSAALKGVSGMSKELESSFRKLKSVIDPTFAAQEKYNRMLAEGKRLMQADLITRKEYNAVKRAAKQQLDEETAAIARNTAAGKAAATAAAAAVAKKKADAAQAKQAAVELARAEAAAAREAAREQAAAAKMANAEKMKAIREAAAAARQAAAEQKRLDREAAASARQANRERIAAAANAAKAAKASAREQAAAAREAAEAIQRQAVAERQAAQAAQEMRAAIDPAYASQQRYNQTMAQATQLLMTGKLRQGEWTAIQKQAKAQMDLNVRSLGRLNSVYVQMGYQAQDVTASLASGISPMVILAQQSGQTAAALSQLGGTVGKVASFIAGPWGAAIIGVTLLLSYLTKETEEEKEAAEEAKKATVDLKNAEDVRRASLDKLTKSLKEYNKAQREANITREEGLQLESAAATQGIAMASKDINKALDAIAAAQDKLKNMGPMPSSKGGMEIYIAQQLMAQNE